LYWTSPTCFHLLSIDFGYRCRHSLHSICLLWGWILVDFHSLGFRIFGYSRLGCHPTISVQGVIWGKKYGACFWLIDFWSAANCDDYQHACFYTYPRLPLCLCDTKINRKANFRLSVCLHCFWDYVRNPGYLVSFCWGMIPLHSFSVTL
jgi:hypothetical protein